MWVGHTRPQFGNTFFRHRSSCQSRVSQDCRRREPTGSNPGSSSGSTPGCSRTRLVGKLPLLAADHPSSTVPQPHSSVEQCGSRGRTLSQSFSLKGIAAASPCFTQRRRRRRRRRRRGRRRRGRRRRYQSKLGHPISLSFSRSQAEIFFYYILLLRNLLSLFSLR